MDKYLKAYFWKALTALKAAILWIFCGIGNLLLNKGRHLDLTDIRKILVIHGEHASIGDAVLFSAMLAPLRKRFPKAKIHVLIRHPAEEILKFNPNIDELIPYTAEKGSNLLTQEFSPLKVVEEMKKRKYDLVITSEHALRFIMLSYLTGARNRVGYDAQGRGFLLTKKVEYPPYEKRQRLELEYYLDLVRALGIEVRPSKEMMRVHYSAKERAFANRFLASNNIRKSDLIIGIHAGGGIWKKRWPIGKFAKLADALSERYGAKVIAFGGEGDAQIYAQMGKLMKNKLVVAAGKCTALGTAALLERCDLVVANDSAVSHIAAAAGIPVIALFGVDSPRRWAPFGNTAIMKHRRLPACATLCNYNYLYSVDACFDEVAPYCMNLISVEDVMEEVAKAIRMKGARKK